MSEGEIRVRVMLPRALLEYSGGEDSVEMTAGTLAEVIVQLNSRFPGIGERILDDRGQLRKFVHTFVNQDSVSHLEPESVPLHPGDTVHILPSVAGG
ncbi:MAG: MoaD/ThiS family protein [Candidatus Thermoplasmatota archaeon]|nr:MoaD/ThiS family protein [Candidatus Thermoplasmatota archaeon]